MFSVRFCFSGRDQMKIISFVLAVCVILCNTAFSVCAVTLDGTIARAEWRDIEPDILINAARETNCSIDYASLVYYTDEPNYSVFFAIKYTAEDYSLEENGSCIEMSVNGKYAATVYADGRTPDVDTDKFDVESAIGFFDLYRETHMEIRLGIKYGIDENTVIGFRIFDFHAIPSNYYEVKLYESEHSEEETETEKTTKEKKKEEETKKKATEKSTEKESVTSTTAVQVRTTRQVIMAETATLSTTTEKSTEKTTKQKEKTTKVTTQKAEQTKKTTTQKLTEPKETDVKEEPIEKITTVGVSQEMNDISVNEKISKAPKMKTVGYCIATAMVVGAIFTGVISSVIKSYEKGKNEDESDE